MKKHLLWRVLLPLLVFNAMLVKAQVQQEKEEAAGISARLEHEINITADPKLGYVPKSRLIAASVQKLRSNQGFRSASSFTLD
jgi:hypothetical protein